MLVEYGDSGLAIVRHASHAGLDVPVLGEESLHSGRARGGTGFFRSDSWDEATATACSSIGYSRLPFVASSGTIGSSKRLTHVSAADIVIATEE